MSKPRSKVATKIAIVAILIAAVAGAFYLRESKSGEPASTESQVINAICDQAQSAASLPRLVDLGAGKCIPCKMMAPILEQLKKDFEGKFEVVVIDVWKDQAKATEYGVRLIPTQIFYDASGKELFRHQGFFSREDILKTWRNYGHDFGE
ncbi:MAG: thioredoxin family protein [Candidatus Coatesbacteria bacterium]|nr:thioredoxin family protein [Candidatus Coatesbacteria bacterium]